jgi:hypothetical protein
MKRLALLVILLAVVSGAWAVDFGTLVGIAPSYGDGGFEFSTGLTPWLSASLGGESELYLSASLYLDLEGETWDFGFAPQRFEMVLRPVAGTVIRAGRLHYADRAGIAISGLYDGFRVQTPLAGLNVDLGALYGGLQDKKDTTLLLSGADITDITDDAVWFAPGRVVFSAAVSKPGTVTYFANALGQFDTRGSSALHSQYLVLGADGALGGGFDFGAALTAAIVEAAGFDPEFSAAASADFGWMPAGQLRDRAYFNIRWASGDNGVLSPFLSVNSIPQGKVFAPRLSGLALARVGYNARLVDTLAVDVQSSAFIRSTAGGPSDSGIDPSSDSAWLGAELFASLRWAPLSDVNISSGLGLFIPGTAFLPDEPLRYLVSLALVLSL